MPNLYISEYSATAKAAGNYPIQVGAEPAEALQKVVYTTSTQSSRFQDTTNFLRITADANCWIKFGVNPTATVSSMFIPEGSVEYFGVDARTSPFLAVYDGSS